MLRNTHINWCRLFQQRSRMLKRASANPTRVFVAERLLWSNFVVYVPEQTADIKDVEDEVCSRDCLSRFIANS